MFDTLKQKIGKDNAFPARAAELGYFRAVLKGTLYDCLRFEFHEEYDGGEQYVPLAQRRPSVRYNLCRLLVEDSVSLLFGEGRFPKIKCANLNVIKTLEDIIEETGLCAIMQDAAFRGSVGSIAIWMRVIESRLFFDVLDTDFLTPKWKASAPDTLESVTERYKVRGSDLAALGYPIQDGDLRAQFWFQRVWDEQNETWFLPFRVIPPRGQGAEEPVIDSARSVEHGLGFVPIVWIKNLAGGNGIDGACTFEPAIETQIEIEYNLSQNGRGLKYSADPTLLVKEPAGIGGGSIVKSAGNALMVAKDGDAKLLEIGGTASAAVIEYVKALREMALESIHGNRSNADKVNAAQSGRALEMLHQPLIWLADKLRTSYGSQGLLPLLRMVIKARRVVKIDVFDEPIPEFPAGSRIMLEWPPWFHRTTADMASDANRIQTLAKGGLISRKTGVTVLKDDNGVVDVDAEITAIETDIAAEDERAAALGAQTKATETLPA